MLPPHYSCPRCKCHALYRKRRKGLDWLMSLFGFRPARCLTCSKKFYIYMRHAPAENEMRRKDDKLPDVQSERIPERAKLYPD